MAQLDLKLIPVTPFQQNCSLLWDTESAKELGVTIKEIWLTHGHLDHAGGAEDIRKDLAIPVIGPHKDDQFWMDTIEQAWAKYGHAGMGKNIVLKIAFVGDVLFRGSVGRTDFPKSDPQALIDSIRTKLWPLGGDMRFVPGHGPMSTFGAERADNPFVGDRVIGMVGGNTSGVM